ncbi:Derepression protein [Citrobacter freundii]|uniref:Derepression protein n=1 Tax=Enterobacteriaceae TaxID=543 RepID=UPI000CB5AF47|nr:MULTISPECIES: Derepression protein [Enterobacteriaceae]EHF8252285.1 Derepression protein [Enterobacter roggenkampii]OZO83814.1 Derepression protein [Escherichia coli]HAL0942533.1 Derepression protein [Escherichia coli]HCL5570058.1 Derepression protein [Citrobacter freundii]HED3087678.1 Derepression protein [Citrobacter freundii]
MTTSNHIQNVNPSHLSIENYHKLNRARNVAFQMHLHIRQCEANAMPLLWIPDIFSYISEDISSVLQEVKRLGICDKYLGHAVQEDKE